jgi:hypothetical protein
MFSGGHQIRPGEWRSIMKNVLKVVMAAVLVLTACTVNAQVYGSSTGSGGLPPAGGSSGGGSGR